MTLCNTAYQGQNPAKTRPPVCLVSLRHIVKLHREWWPRGDASPAFCTRSAQLKLAAQRSQKQAFSLGKTHLFNLLLDVTNCYSVTPCFRQKPATYPATFVHGLGNDSSNHFSDRWHLISVANCSDLNLKSEHRIQAYQRNLLTHSPGSNAEHPCPQGLIRESQFKSAFETTLKKKGEPEKARLTHGNHQSRHHLEKSYHGETIEQR